MLPFTPVMTSEKTIQSRILLDLGSEPSVRMFTNPVGQAWIGQLVNRGTERIIIHPRRVTYGLTPGSADLIGWHSYTVVPNDVGRTVAIFTSVEVKKPVKSVTSGIQINWLQQIRRAGGIAIIARSPVEARDEVLGWRPQ